MEKSKELSDKIATEKAVAVEGLEEAIETLKAFGANNLEEANELIYKMREELAGYQAELDKEIKTLEREIADVSRQNTTN